LVPVAISELRGDAMGAQSDSKMHCGGHHTPVTPRRELKTETAKSSQNRQDEEALPIKRMLLIR
jgi:hypothetical protein